MKSILAGMLSMGLLAVSCNKEESGAASMPEAGVKTYASLSVSLQNTSTRAVAADPNAVSEETKIGSLNIYIFNGGVLETTGSITLNEQNEGTTSVATTTGPKTIYAVVNKTVTGAVGSLQSDFEQQLLAALDSDIAAADNFFMVGSTGATLVEQTEDQAIEKANLIQISVARAAAKVQMRYNNVPVKPVVDAAVADARYTLAQQNTQMYLLRNGFDVSPKGAAAEQMDADNDGTYDHLKKLDNPLEDANLISAVENFTHAYAESRYLGENVNETPATGNTSYVLICVQVTPNASAGVDGTVTVGGFTAGSDFWVIANHDTANGSIQFAAKEDKILYFASQDAADSYLTVNTADLTGYEVLKYTEGKSYYRLNIRDIRQSALTQKYAVLRNHYYKVNITEISNLGYNSPDGTVPTDPETPLETQTYISAEITIEPWTVVDMNEPLG